MKFTEDIKESLVSKGLVLARPKDRWTMAGDFRVSDEITRCTFLYFVSNVATWAAHAKKSVSKLFPGVTFAEEPTPSWSGDLEIGGGTIRVQITPIQPPASFGFVQLYASLDSDGRKNLRSVLTQTRRISGASEWPTYGFALTEDLGIYRANEHGHAVQEPLVIPHVRFLFLLLRHDPEVVKVARVWRWSL